MASYKEAGVDVEEDSSAVESIFNRHVELIKELQAAEYQVSEFKKTSNPLNFFEKNDTVLPGMNFLRGKI